MKKSTKVWLGIATIWPIAYIFFFIAAVFSMILIGGLLESGNSSGPHGAASVLFPLGFVGLFALHFLTILGSLALTVFYIIRVMKTEQLEQNMKIMWMVLLFFMGMLAQPVFWYLYIWRETPEPNSLGNDSPLLAAGSPSDWAEQSATPSREAAYVPPAQPPDWR